MTHFNTRQAYYKQDGLNPIPLCHSRILGRFPTSPSAYADINHVTCPKCLKILMANLEKELENEIN